MSQTMVHRPRRALRWALAVAALVLAAPAHVGAEAPKIDPLSAAFSFAPTVPNVGQAVSFHGSSSGGPGGSPRYAWSFGDGSSGSGAGPSHPYASGGDKAVKLTVTAGDGSTASASRTVHVNVAPHAALVFAAVVSPPTGQNPFVPLVGQRVAFSAMASSDPDGSITGYEWDLGDGSFGAPARTSALITTFGVAGPRTVRVRVTDSGGAVDVASATFRVNAPPVADFTFAPTGPLPDQVVQLTSSASDPDGGQDIASLGWELNGDGKFDDATGPAPQAIFAAPGDHQVGIRVKDSGGATATAFRTISVAAAALAAGSPAAAAIPPARAPAGGPAAMSASGSSLSPAGKRSPARPALKTLAGVRVQIAGRLLTSRTSVTQLIIVAPKGALVRARCEGAGCAHRRLVRLRVGSSGKARLRPLERTLGAGAQLRVSVTRSGYLTRRIVFTIRRGRPPERHETCEVAGSRRTRTCGIR